MSETLRRVQMLVPTDEYRVSRHGFRELALDGILVREVLAGIGVAIVIEDYPTSRMEPSVLVLQRDSSGRPIHVMWACRKRPERRLFW
jgi:predicted nuclease with RNAse H fold